MAAIHITTARNKKKRVSGGAERSKRYQTTGIGDPAPPGHTSRLGVVGRGGNVSTTASPVDVDVGVFRVLRAGELRLDAEGMGAEVVSLSLQQVGWEILGTVAIVEAKSSAEGRGWDTPESTLADDVSPSGLSRVDGLVEEVIEQEVLQVRVLAVGAGDILEEDRADNATTTPHQGNGWLVELPLVLLGGLSNPIACQLRVLDYVPTARPGGEFFTYVLDQHKALGIGDDLGGIESLLKVRQELLLVALELGSWSFEDLGSTLTLGLDGAQATSKDGLTNQGDGHAEVKGIDGGPLAGTLLASRVEDFLHEGATVIIGIGEDVSGDLNQERVQHTLVPLGKDLGHLLGSHTETTLHDIIRLLSAVSFPQDSRLELGRGAEDHTSVINCISPYSIPLWTILT